VNLKNYIREVADFPKPGIRFQDITPLLLNPQAFAEVIAVMAARVFPYKPQKICGIEARGFLFGMPLAQKLGIGFVPARKPGKLPSAVVSQIYDLEYGSDELQVHKDAFAAEERVLIVDDVLATGGTAQAAQRLIEKTGAEVVAQVFLMELLFLNGSAKLGKCPVISVLQY
jgi:adenine phosphoribosyltransferase